jgi:hypothetical protein
MSTPPKLYLYKRSNGIYFLGYLDNGRKRWKSTKATQRTDILRVLANYKDLLHHKPAPKLLSEFIDKFLPYAEQIYSRGNVVIIFTEIFLHKCPSINIFDSNNLFHQKKFL